MKIFLLILHTVQINALSSLYSYLKDTADSILSGVPQGSILGPIAFNMFLNGFFYFIRDCNLNNFAHDNTLSAAAEFSVEVITNLESEIENAVQ